MSRSTDRCQRRCRGDRGAGMAFALVLIFAFTAGGVIWLTRDVGTRVAQRSAAQSVAFQAARAGAQQLSPDTMRGDADPGIDIQLDVARARDAALTAANNLLDAYHLSGSVEVAVEGDPIRVVVTVTIQGRAGPSQATGVAEPERFQ